MVLNKTTLVDEGNLAVSEQKALEVVQEAMSSHGWGQGIKQQAKY